MWPKIPAGFVRAMLAGHSALGLFFAAAIYLVCLTGTLVVFHAEMLVWEQPEVSSAQSTNDAAIVAAFEQIAARGAAHENLHGVNVFAPGAFYPWLAPRFFTDDGDFESWAADAETGELIAMQNAPYADFLASLHITLRLPAPYGIYTVGLIGVAMLSLLISGILAHPRIFKDAFALRWGGSKRLQEADLHNRLSVWALPFHLMISFTGAFLGLTFLVVGILALVAFEGDQDRAIRAVIGPQATEDHTPAPIPDLAPIIADARARMSESGAESGDGSEVYYVSVEHPGTLGQMITVDMTAPRDLTPSETFFYGADGGFIEQSGYAAGDIGKQTVAALGPLHFGSFGGLWVKVAYVVFGLASTTVAASGVSIWLARRRDRGRPAPRWERVWAGCVWGGALACATPGLAAPWAESIETMTAVFVATLAVALAFSLAMSSAAIVSRALRSTLALATAAIVAGNAVAHGGHAWSGASLGVNLALLATAVAVVASIAPVRAVFAAGQAGRAATDPTR